MAPLGGAGVQINVLEADSELAEGIPADQLPFAKRSAMARVITLTRGLWDPEPTFAGGEGLLGILILDGLILRESSVGRASTGQLLGAGDVERPWQQDGLEASAVYRAVFKVLEPTPIAILDWSFASGTARWPSIMTELAARSARARRALAFQLTLMSIPRLDERLHLLLWHLADRWGTVEPLGVALRLRLTHEVLSRLVGAQRPSVSRALGVLQDQGLVIQRPGRTWLLMGAPPADAGRPSITAGPVAA